MTGSPTWRPSGGDMADRIGQFDWSTTPLGPLDQWPQSLRTAIDLVLASGHAMQLAWGPSRTILYNDAYAPMLGERHPTALGLPFKSAWPEIWSDIEPLVNRVFDGETVRFQDLPLVMTRNGYAEDTWWNFSYSPVRDEAGQVAGLLNVTMDATSRVRAERAEQERDDTNRQLRASEERQAFLLRLSDLLRPLSDATLARSVGSRALGESIGADRAYYVEFEAAAGYGLVADDYKVEGLPSLAGRYPFEAFRSTYERVAKGGAWVVRDVRLDADIALLERQTYEAQGVMAWVNVPLLKNNNLRAVLCVVQSGPRNWSATEIERVEETADRLWAAIERARAEEHQAILLAELQHRVRNTLSVIRSIIRRTAEATAEKDEMIMHLTGRVDSFARVQTAVTRSPTTPVSLATLIAEELRVVGANEGPRLSISGPSVGLSPKAAETIGLAVHELTTNAIKYGALTQDSARLVVSWEIVGDLLRFSWMEQGVARDAISPDRKGLGTEILTRTVPYQLTAEADLSFGVDGVAYTMTAPVAQLQA